MANQFFPVRLNTLRSNDAVSFDVYIKVGDRYIHYTHMQDELEGERLKSLKSKGVRKLFIRPEHEDAYLLYLEDGLNTLTDNKTELSERASRANDTMVTAAENAEKTLETEKGYQGQKVQFEKIAEFLTSDKNALKGILNSAGISSDTNQHAATVSSLSIALAQKVGITDQNEIFELGLAALLHDIGKSRLKFDPMKPTAELTPAELKQYKNHPRDGADMLAGKPYISPRILGLIASHEERGEMRGYPEKKNLFKMDLSYQILSLTNQFDHFSWEKKIPPVKAIDPFFEAFGKDYAEDLIMNLATVLT
ncbi:MAG: HD-GYP domain-containing protein [Bacteriovoracaceae bacterium]